MNYIVRHLGRYFHYGINDENRTWAFMHFKQCFHFIKVILTNLLLYDVIYFNLCEFFHVNILVLQFSHPR